MNPNELRIGNWVEHNGNWSYRSNSEPTQIQWNENDWYSLIESTLDIEDISPIILTEEWLIKFGFIKTISIIEVTNEFWKMERMELQNVGKGFYRLRNYYNGGGETESTQIKYVHELQNLHFALTGKELIRIK